MENKEMIKSIITMLTEACSESKWETARFLLQQLDTYGFHYAKQDNHAVFKLNGTVYRVPLEEEKKKKEEDVPDFDASDFWSDNVVTSESNDIPLPKNEAAEQPVLKERDILDDILGNLNEDKPVFNESTENDKPAFNPWTTELPCEKEEEKKDINVEESVEDVFNGLFGATVSKEESVWGKQDFAFTDTTPVEVPDSTVEDELDALLKSLDVEDADTKGVIQEQESPILTEEMKKDIPETPATEPKPIPETSFSRMDADATPERTPGHKFMHDESGKEEKPQGYEPPLTGEIIPNTEIALSDCVYSIFLADVYEESSILKQKIFFMVAPFEVSEESPSVNIFMYAYMNGQNYSSNSLKNPNKNSLYCQIGPYEFFIRGWLRDGKWQAEIKLAGNSLTRHDIFEITNVMHFSPSTLGKTNGHIRFRYKGFVNHKELESLGCVNIFPIDPNTRDFVMIRCIEDFMDVFYSTDEGKTMELQTMDGVKEVKAVCDEYGICRAVITDRAKQEEEAMIQ